MKWLLALVRQLLQHVPDLLHIHIVPDDFELCLDLVEFGEVVRRELFPFGELFNDVLVVRGRRKFDGVVVDYV